jgi:saccharopine dehydrogenase-like NADP-dependent oxidoreductase
LSLHFDHYPDQLSGGHSFDFIDKAKIQAVRIDVNDPNALASKMDEKFDVVLDFLPPECIRTVAEAAIQSGVHFGTR